MKTKLPLRFERITSKRVRNDQLHENPLHDPKADREEAIKDQKALADTLGVWSVGFLDIETTGLGADFGHVLCACIKPMVSADMITLRIDDYKGYKKELCNDKALVLAIKEQIAKFDVLVHYNGDQFDLPFIDTRLAIHGERRAPLVHSIDLLPIVKKKLRLHSNRLDTVATALGLVHQKTKLDPQVWQRASHGSKADLDYIVEHCEADVYVLEETFKRLKDYIDSIFRRR